MIVYDHTVSERYARALFNIVKKKGLQKEILGDAEQLIILLRKDSKMAVFLEGPQFATEEKVKFLDKVLKEKLHPLLSQLLSLLLSKGRIEYTRPVLTRFMQLVEEDQGIREADVATAAALNDEDKSKVKSALERRVNSQLRLRFHTDPSLIGGVRFAMGDLLIDDSVKGKLEKLRFKLEAAIRV